MVVRVMDGGIESIRSDTAFGTSLSNFAAYSNLVLFDGGTAALRSIDNNSSDSTLGWIDLSTSTGFRAVSPDASLFAWSGWGEQACHLGAGSLNCLFVNRTGVDLGDVCRLPSATEPDAGVVLVFDENLRCKSARRTFDGFTGVQMSNLSTENTFVFSGCVLSGFYRADDGSRILPNHCFAYETGPATSRFSQRPFSAAGLLPLQVFAFADELVLVHYFFPPFSGFDFTSNDFVVLVTFLSRDLQTIKRRLAFTTPEMINDPLRPSRLFFVEDKVAMFVTGRRISLNGRRLSSVDTEQTHLLVFQR